MKPSVTGLILIMSAFSPGSMALANPATPASLPFEQLTALVGQWEGKRPALDGEETITVDYKLTAKGTALVERLFPGTPKEMVSVYTEDGPEVIMTHYCMLGNQPRMRTNGKSKPNGITFTYIDGTGMRSTHDLHMHELTITFLDKDHITHQWTLFDKGQKKVIETFVFTRKY
ncbi:MAG: hypothetical protein IH977_09760 [Nitrospinae bacterium]|nr:hypothetical protein [Nitrospinota bacterium]